ncbi:hypothetical protein Gpo141_00005578 [Globisporangium polare]
MAAATAAAAAALDAPVPLAFVNAFLRVDDLLSLRAVSRSCLRILPLYTRALVGSKLARDSRAFSLLTTYFPLVTTFALRECKLRDYALIQALQCVAGNWTQLKALELSNVRSLNDAHVALCLQLCGPTLESLVIAQCYQIKTPSVCGPRLRHLRIQNCFFTQFDPESHLPALQELHIVSQVLDTLNVRHLVKHTLAKSNPPLRVLSLGNCGAVTQVLIDPMELPKLKTLDLRSCHTLERVHVASQSLERLDLSLCAELQHAVLDLQSALSVDLSYLKAMTHLFLRAEALRMLNLYGCSQLEKQHLRVACPVLQVVQLSGTNVALEDLNSAEQEMMVA